MANNLDENGAQPEKKQSLKDIQVPNWLAFLLIGAVAAAGIAVFSLTRTAPAPASAPGPGTSFSSEVSPDASEVEVLPQPVRNFGEGDVPNPFANEDLGAVKVTGVISNSNGKATAIIETASSSYILGVGDTVPGSSWSVSKVGKNSVTFSNNGSEKTVYMDGQK